MLAKKGKKGGGKKAGGKQGKKGGFAWASSFELKPFEAASLRTLAESVAQAHELRSGQPLHPSLVGVSDG